MPIVFCDTRSLAEEWTFRFLGAAAVLLGEEPGAEAFKATLAEPPPLEPAEPSVAEIRRWALDAGFDVSDRGRIRVEIRDAFHSAHDRGATD